MKSIEKKSIEKKSDIFNRQNREKYKQTKIITRYHNKHIRERNKYNNKLRILFVVKTRKNMNRKSNIIVNKKRIKINKLYNFN